MSAKVKFETAFTTYTSINAIGEGGAGRVFKVIDEEGKPFAIKMLDPSKASGERRKRFKNELHFCLKNNHCHIVTVLDHGIVNVNGTTAPFYVMPLYSGSLRTIMKGITPDRIPVYFSQLLDGVEAAHLKKVIHRDLKPENVLYDDQSDRLVIADFGIASFAEEEIHTLFETNPHTRLANFLYAAPEQRCRSSAVDHRADIYALGLMLNEMFTGEIPYGTAYKTISPVVPEFGYYDELVSMMLRQSPADRPGSIDEIKRQLLSHQDVFVSRQRLSALKETVVPVTDLDDPLILDPPRIVNFDWGKGVLTLIFQRTMNEKWLYALMNMGGHTAVTGKGPNNFQYSGNKAVIRAEEHELQNIINYFKAWLPQAQRVYEGNLRREKREFEERQRQQLKAQIEEEARRLRVLNTIKL